MIHTENEESRCLGDDTSLSERALRRRLAEAQVRYLENCNPETRFEYVRALIAFRDYVMADKATV